MKQELVFSLKEKLDEIDNRVVNEVFNNYYESRYRILVGMWEKGEAIDVVFRGVKTTSSYRELEKQTGRDDGALKRWHDLYKQYPEKEKFISEYAEPKAKLWTKRAFEKEKGLLSEFIESPPFPEGKYRVIYADPPWQYSNKGLGGSAEKHYRTLSLFEIINYEDTKGKRVVDLTGENSVLFLWVPNAFLEEGLEVCESWGFDYKTNFIWIKQKSAYGKLAFYNYGQHEFLFIATRGSILPKESSLVSSIIYAEKSKHSKKPEIIYEIIESMYSPPYIELFARNKRKDWEYWGDEII